MKTETGANLGEMETGNFGTIINRGNVRRNRNWADFRIKETEDILEEIVTDKILGEIISLSQCSISLPFEHTKETVITLWPCYERDRGRQLEKILDGLFFLAWNSVNIWIDTCVWRAWSPKLVAWALYIYIVVGD